MLIYSHVTNRRRRIGRKIFSTHPCYAEFRKSTPYLWQKTRRRVDIGQPLGLDDIKIIVDNSLGRRIFHKRRCLGRGCFPCASTRKSLSARPIPRRWATPVRPRPCSARRDDRAAHDSRVGRAVGFRAGDAKQRFANWLGRAPELRRAPGRRRRWRAIKASFAAYSPEKLYLEEITYA